MTAAPSLSVRARQALGAAAVELFCRKAHISDSNVDLFISHLWSLACAPDIPRWEEEGRTLAIAGRGDPLPSALVTKIGRDTAAQFARVTEVAHEISMSQLFGASAPEQSAEFLAQTLVETGIEFAQEGVPLVLARHLGESDGWGAAVARNDLPTWQSAARKHLRIQE